jgi:hypothetical protein
MWLHLCFPSPTRRRRWVQTDSQLTRLIDARTPPTLHSRLKIISATYARMKHAARIMHITPDQHVQLSATSSRSIATIISTMSVHIAQARVINATLQIANRAAARAHAGRVIQAMRRITAAIACHAKRTANARLVADVTLANTWATSTPAILARSALRIARHARTRRRVKSAKTVSVLDLTANVNLVLRTARNVRKRDLANATSARAPKQ